MWQPGDKCINLMEIPVYHTTQTSQQQEHFATVLNITHLPL